MNPYKLIRYNEAPTELLGSSVPLYVPYVVRPWNDRLDELQIFTGHTILPSGYTLEFGESMLKTLGREGFLSQFGGLPKDQHGEPFAAVTFASRIRSHISPSLLERFIFRRRPLRGLKFLEKEILVAGLTIEDCMPALRGLFSVLLPGAQPRNNIIPTKDLDGKTFGKLFGF